MISISTLVSGRQFGAHRLRYGRPADRPPGPVVVYNCTSACNLDCSHCYAQGWPAESLSTDQAKAMLGDLAAMGCPVVLFSGGEPLLREDLSELAAHAVGLGMRAVVSSNGTLITPAQAEALARAGVSYVGISLDGMEATHDRLRGRKSAFRQALAGLEHCRAAGLKVGLRVTLTRQNLSDLPGLLDLARQRRIPRLCLYHLVYTGRGGNLREADLTAPQRRSMMDLMIARAAEASADGDELELLTVDNHADGPYLYLQLQKSDPARAQAAMDLLRISGGNASGERIGCVRPDGTVLPDQFWQSQPLGNVRQRPFSSIWTDAANPLLASLRRRPRPLTGRCRCCRFLDICNGNFRARAEQATGDIWGDDPACYLTDEEIAPRG
jgi:radical SAM protein with 4Fe4S-binding SPASM domain